MDLNKYQEKAKTTAIYPNAGNNFAYAALGLADEAAEVMEKVTQGASTNEKAKELGDVMWYSSACATEIGRKLGDLFEKHGCENLGDEDKILKEMCILAGAVAGKAKKAIRDDEGKITDKRADEIASLLAKLNFTVGKYASNLSTSLSKVCDANIEKLFDRKDRGVLKGSGDNR